MINFWKAGFDNAVGNVARGAVISVTTTPELRRDGTRLTCRDGVRNPTKTGGCGNPGSESNRLPDYAGSLKINTFHALSRRAAPSFLGKDGYFLDRLSGSVTPDNALGRRYRTCSKPPISDPDNARPVTNSVTPVRALPQGRCQNVVHSFSVRKVVTVPRFKGAAAGQAWRIA
jgi:hypothetical protein